MLLYNPLYSANASYRLLHLAYRRLCIINADPDEYDIIPLRHDTLLDIAEKCADDAKLVCRFRDLTGMHEINWLNQMARHRHINREVQGDWLAGDLQGLTRCATVDSETGESIVLHHGYTKPTAHPLDDEDAPQSLEGDVEDQLRRDADDDGDDDDELPGASPYFWSDFLR